MKVQFDINTIQLRDVIFDPLCYYDVQLKGVGEAGHICGLCILFLS